MKDGRIPCGRSPVGALHSVFVACVLACGLVLATEARADGKPIPAKPKKKQTQAEQVRTSSKPLAAPETIRLEKQVVTGTQVPKYVDNRTRVANSAAPIQVIDSEAIRRSGYSSVSDIIRRYSASGR